MLIGIDDSGNFSTDHFNLFAAVFMRPKKRAQIEKKFTAWEHSLPDSAKNNHGEVKGYLLTEEQIHDFIESIFINNGYGKMSHFVYAVENSAQQRTKIEARRNRLLSQLQAYKAQSMANKNGEMTNFLNGMHGWLKKLSAKNVLKLELLQIIAFEAFRLAPLTAMLSKHDKELGDLEINIDKGIIEKPQASKYWQKLLADAFWEYSYYGKNFYQFTEWGPKHPYVRRFIENPFADTEIMSFSSEAPHCMTFKESRDNFEIRIADIIANIYYRYLNLQKCVSTIETLKKYPAYKHHFTICDFDDEQIGPTPPSPYNT